MYGFIKLSTLLITAGMMCFFLAVRVESRSLATFEKGKWSEIKPGVWKATFGAGELITLLEMAGVSPKDEALEAMGTAEFPFSQSTVKGAVIQGKTVIRLPFGKSEKLYGFGLNFKTVDQTRKVRHLHVDHYGGRDDGRTHAPVPFYVSSAGYGVLFDTAEYISVHTGIANRKDDPNHPAALDRNTDKHWVALPNSYVVEAAVPAGGVDVLVFAGPTPLDAVRRFNLYCGGGCLPPLWGLGFWHRTPTLYSDKDVMAEVDEFIDRGYPLSVLGLEPGWHSKSYPCTYEWDRSRFPDPGSLLEKLKAKGIRINLWENPYVSPDAGLYNKLLPYSGSHTVWCGIIPDYTMPEACSLLRKQHEREHLDIGVSGYKIDECDGFDRWLWPDHATFPSGLTGSQMRQTYALQLQRLYTDMFRSRNTRTYGLIRASNAGGVSFPFVIYNDYYSHRDFITALCNSGFSGILWTPEVRASESAEEWLRRMQSVCFSPMAMINAWADGTKPWSFPEVADEVREIMNLRIKFIPYLYTAFARYHFDGTPPFRSMHLEPEFVLDKGQTGGTLDSTKNPYAIAVSQEVKDQFMVGDCLLAAPMFAGETERKVILPRGKWYDFYTGAYAGSGEIITVRPGLDTIPLYVKDGGIIPLFADNKKFTGTAENIGLELRHYGESPSSSVLYEDDGVTYDYERGEYGWRELRVKRMPDGTLTGNVSERKDNVPALWSTMTWRFMTE